MFFDSWSDIERTLVVGVLAYLGLVFFLRVSGKRTLSKMDAFDFVITTALGSTLAQVVLSKDVALLKGLLAFALLIDDRYKLNALHLLKGKVGAKPVFSDSEVITLMLAQDFLCFDLSGCRDIISFHISRM